MKMKQKKSMIVTVTCASALAVASFARGGELQNGWVSAGADWVVHVDMEALAHSVLGNLLLSCGGEDVRNGLQEFEADMGLDLQEDVLSLTAYGTIDALHKDRVLIAVTTSRVDEALARLTSHPDLTATTLTLAGHEVHVLSNDDGQVYLHLRPFEAFDERRILVLADERYVLLSALDVLEGKADHRGAAGEEAAQPRDGSLIFAAVEELASLRQLDPALKFIRLSEGFTLDVGESEDLVWADAVVTAGSEADAGNIAQAVRGLVALGRLAIDQERDLAPLRPLVQGLTATASEARVALQLRVDVRAFQGVAPAPHPGEDPE